MESPDEQQDITDKKEEQAEEEACSGLEDVSDDDDEEEDDDGDDDDEEDEEWESEDEAGEEEENEADDDGDEAEGDGDDAEEEDDDDEEDEEEEDAVLEASDSEGEGGERCPICLNRFKDQDVGTPEACDHIFCLECIQEWSNNVNTCPVDRQVFKLILCKHGVDDIIYKKLTVEDVNKQADNEEEEEPTYCEICHQCDREDCLLLCDGCDLGYHLECLTPPLSQVPVEEWFCPSCARREGADADYLPHTAGHGRQISRTLVMERVRRAIEERRVRRTRNLRRIESSDEEEEEEEEEIEDTAPSAATSSSTSSSPAKKSPVKKPTRRRKTPRKYPKRRKRKTTKKKTTKKKATPGKKKTATKTKKRKTPKRRKTKRRGKKGRKVKRLARTAKPAAVTSVKTRIAGALGITNPPPGRTIPIQKTKQEKSVDMKMADIGAASLSIFGHRDQINFYEDEQDEPGTSTTVGSSGTRKYSRLALSSYKPIGRVPANLPLRKKKKIVINTQSGATGGSLDLLGSIMQSQDKLHMSSKNVTIQRDGSLTAKPSETSQKTTKTSETGSSLFKSSFTVVESSSNKPASVLSSLSTEKGKSVSPEKQTIPDEEYDPAFPTDEFEDDLPDENKNEDVYDPAHPTDDFSSDEDIADKSNVDTKDKVHVNEKSKSESVNEKVKQGSENIKIKVEKEDKEESKMVVSSKTESMAVSSKTESMAVSSKTESMAISSKAESMAVSSKTESTKLAGISEKPCGIAKHAEVSKVKKESAIFSEHEVSRERTGTKGKLPIDKKESDKKSSPEIPLLKQQKTPEKLSSAEKKENPLKKSPSIKITETNKKSSLNVKPFEISRKTLFEKRRLYGGEIDFSEDVDFSEGAFPDTFELSVKRIEEVFKGTKSKVEPKTNSAQDKVSEPEKSLVEKAATESAEKEKSEKVEKEVKEKPEKENLNKLSKESKQSQEDKIKVKSEKDSKEKTKFTGKFKPISSNTNENVGTTKISVSDRFKKINEERKTPEISNLEEEDPIHEMRKLDKELDLEFGNADFRKRKEKDKEAKKTKRKVSLDENDSENIRHRRESKENKEKRKVDSDKYVYEEKEEGEVDDEFRLKEKKKKDRKKRKIDKERDKYYDEKVESDIDRRIVIQVTQNTEDRTVWEEEERRRKKRDREERKRDKMKAGERDTKKERKHKRLRSRSRSHERRNRSRSREKKRSRSRSRDRDRSRERIRRKRRERSRSRSKEWSQERSRKKKKRDRNRSRDRDRDVSREWSPDRSRDWSRERDWSSERGRDRSRGHSRDRKREHSEDKVDIFGRSRSPFTRREFLKDKQNLTPRKKPKPQTDDDDVILLDSPPSPKKPTYDEVSSSESEKEAENEPEKIETISRIEVKNNTTREAPAPFVETEDKDDEFDDEPEETEQFQYTDRDEYLGQNKSKQMRQNLITIGVSGNDYDPANPTGTTSPAPPLPEPMSAPTPPLPPSGDFTQFPPPPPGPPPQGPPPGSVILQEHPQIHVQAGGPPGQNILGEGPIILQGPPPSIETGPPPGIIQQRPAMSVPVNINVLPPGFHRGLPPTITPQRQLIVSPLRPAAPRLQRLASPGGVRFGWQVTTTSEVIPSQFGSRIPSPASLPGHPLVNGPFDGLPPPHSEALPLHSLPPGHPQFPPAGEPPHMLAIKTDTPPPNIVQIPVEVNEPPRHLPPPGPEPQLIHLGPDPRAPPPRLPIPLLPSTSEPPPMSVMVSIPPPNSSLMSMPPPGTNMPEPFPRSDTPPNSVSAILGLARMGSASLPVSSAMIPGLSSSAAMVNGDSMVPSMNPENRLKAKGTLNELEKISELLNTQAQLMVVSKERRNSGESETVNSNKSGIAVKMEDVFKVPLVPAGKSGVKTEVDATEVVDMDMGSPINEEGNIELPVSPQFDNLIDNPEDLLEEDFNKKMQKLHEKDMKIEIDIIKDKTLTPTKNKDVKDLEKKDSPLKIKEEKHKRSSKENKHEKSGHKSRRHKTKPEKDLKEKALKDAHLDLDTQEVPSSAVDMTNKEKYLKKLHLQERVVEEVKMAIKPFYSGKKINKDQYKEILRKAVPKICHSKSGNINPMKIKSLVEAYVMKYTRQSDPSIGESAPSPELNGESAKTKGVR